MTAEIVNLRRVRRHKARAEREQQAAERRAAFGRTKAEKKKIKLEQAQSEAALDGHRRAPEDGDA